MKDVGFTEYDEENRDHVSTCGNIDEKKRWTGLYEIPKTDSETSGV